METEKNESEKILVVVGALAMMKKEEMNKNHGAPSLHEIKTKIVLTSTFNILRKKIVHLSSL